MKGQVGLMFGLILDLLWNLHLHLEGKFHHASQTWLMNIEIGYKKNIKHWSGSDCYFKV